MDFAHIVGEHQFDNRLGQLMHVLGSWAGIIVSAIIIGTVTKLILRRTQTAKSKEITKE